MNTSELKLPEKCCILSVKTRATAINFSFIFAPPNESLIFSAEKISSLLFYYINSSFLGFSLLFKSQVGGSSSLCFQQVKMWLHGLLTR